MDAAAPSQRGFSAANAPGRCLEFASLAVCWSFPSAAPFPEELWGRDFVGIAGPYAGDADNRAWARTVAEALEPHSTGGVYLNFDDVTDAASLRRAHGANAARLAEVKALYDPGNLFRSRRLTA